MYNMSYTVMCSSQFINILRPIYYYNEHSVNTLYQISAYQEALLKNRCLLTPL